MKEYLITEVFRSLQGEGNLTGCAATFVRFSGCNLKCQWCDTEHGVKEALTVEQLLERVSSVMGEGDVLVLTGGEPTCQDLGEFLVAFRMKFQNPISIESNGTNPLPLMRWKATKLIDVITISPKDNMLDQNIIDSLLVASEVKVVLADGTDPKIYEPYIRNNIARGTAYIQPCSENYAPAAAFVLANPGWRLGIQAHKVIGVE